MKSLHVFESIVAFPDSDGGSREPANQPFLIDGVREIVLQNDINHCFIGVLHRHFQRRYVAWVKVKRAYVRYVDDIFLIRYQVAYRIIGFIADVASGTVVDLCDLIRTTPPNRTCEDFPNQL